MPVICDTSSVPAEDRAELWVAASSNLFVPLECRPHDRSSFKGLLQAGVVGPLALGRLQVSPHTIRRTRALAADTNGDQYKLSLLLGGRALVIQDGREAVLRPGDFALYDCSRPYTIEGTRGFRMLVCMLPRAMLGLDPARVARMTATRICGDNGIGWAVAPFLDRLGDLAIRGEMSAGQDRVVESVLELVESLCSSVIANDGTPPSSSRAELLLRARAHAQAHLDDPLLSPGEIATAVHVSKRYLHRLFEDDGSTVSSWIRRRRLEGCRRDLADPSRRTETVTSIGARWGLANPAHLSRLFRDAYGVSPTEYRAEQPRFDDGT
ncbi:MAG: AraC-like ligand-binding domain-containing protein [Gaiellaceae bacterium]